MITETGLPRLGGSEDSEFYRSLERGPHIARCGECTNEFFYYRPFCPRCLSDDVAPVPVRQSSRVVSFTHVYRVQSPIFATDEPRLMIAVALGDCHMIVEGEGWGEQGPTIGLGVTLTVRQREDGSRVILATPE